jgi:hypothetical protein
MPVHYAFRYDPLNHFSLAAMASRLRCVRDAILPTSVFELQGKGSLVHEDEEA